MPSHHQIDRIRSIASTQPHHSALAHPAVDKRLAIAPRDQRDAGASPPRRTDDGDPRPTPFDRGVDLGPLLIWCSEKAVRKAVKRRERSPHSRGSPIATACAGG
jgi:hypothetical protein